MKHKNSCNHSFFQARFEKRNYWRVEIMSKFIVFVDCRLFSLTIFFFIYYIVFSAHTSRRTLMEIRTVLIFLSSSVPSLIHRTFFWFIAFLLAKCNSMQSLTLPFFLFIFELFLWSGNVFINKRTWEALIFHFSNKLRFEQKLYYCRPGLITRVTKIRDKFLTQ